MSAAGTSASGATGELHVRGPNVMAGYWRSPDATREVLLDGGWLRTGDAARMDEDGYIWIVDRFADRFETAGGIVFPGDVERVLLSNLAVADAGVVGVPSADGGQVVAGFVVLAPGAAPTTGELIAGTRRELPAHAVPASIRLVGELPRNSVGKSCVSSGATEPCRTFSPSCPVPVKCLDRGSSNVRIHEPC